MPNDKPVILYIEPAAKLRDIMVSNMEPAATVCSFGTTEEALGFLKETPPNSLSALVIEPYNAGESLFELIDCARAMGAKIAIFTALFADELSDDALEKMGSPEFYEKGLRQNTYAMYQAIGLSELIPPVARPARTNTGGGPPRMQ